LLRRRLRDDDLFFLLDKLGLRFRVREDLGLLLLGVHHQDLGLGK
jgi:hypothetical protein